jgi:hypothetical protein
LKMEIEIVVYKLVEGGLDSSRCCRFRMGKTGE